MNFQDLLEEEGEKKKPFMPPSATHLDTPLTYKAQMLATNRVPENHSKIGMRRMREEYRDLLYVTGLTHGTSMLPWDCSTEHQIILSSSPVEGRDVYLSRFNKYLSGTKNNISLQIPILHQMMSKDDHSKMNLGFLDDVPTSIKRQYCLREFFEGAVRLSGRAFSSRSSDTNLFPSWKITERGLYEGFLTKNIQIVLGKRLAILRTSNGDYLLNRDQLLILSDLASQRFILSISAYWATMLGKTNYLSVEELEFIYQWGDSILAHFGNEGFNIVYKWEAINLSFLLGEIKLGTSEGKTFQQSLLSDLLKDHGSEGLVIWNSAIEFLTTLKSLSNHKISQSYGLYRIWGHPIVDPIAGCINLQKVTKRTRMSDPQLISAITVSFIEKFCIRYWEKHSSWPKLDLSKLPLSHPITMNYGKNSPPPILKDKIQRKGWFLVKTEKTFEVDPKFDLLELLSDKALSFGFEDLKHYVKEKHNIGPSSLRSVIVQWLKSNLSDPIAFLKKIDLEGFSWDERVMGVCPKEREGKMYARMFGLLTLAKRMYVVLTEALLAEHILCYFPEITMTDDAETLTKRQLDMTTKKGKTTGMTLFTSLDFVKWNSNMRYQDSAPLFSLLDGLFGFTRCFLRTHEMFENTYMYLADSFYLPPISATGLKHGLGSWTGHLGGIEGLRQKGWTLWTVCLISLASERVMGKFFIMGQGDNQVIKESYPDNMSTEEAFRFHYMFLNNLDHILSRIGPCLKLEETWSSNSTFVYGKFIIHNGVPLSMSAKRVARMFRLSNDEYPTIESSLSSLAANCSAATSSDFDPLISFLVYSFEALGCIHINLNSDFLHPIPLIETIAKKFNPELSCSIPSKGTRGHNKRLIKKVAVSSPFTLSLRRFGIDAQMRFMLTPRCLGGLPILLFGDMFVRGFPDPISSAVSQLRIVYNSTHNQNLRNAICNILSPHFAPYQNFELLLENPVSLNLFSPSSPSEGKRDLILRYLSGEINSNNSWVKNPSFVSFFAESGKDLTDICNSLLKSTPCFPRLLSEIYHATPTARAKHVVGKLQKTNTLINLSRDSGLDLGSRITQAEKNQIAGVLIQSLTHNLECLWTSETCSVTWAGNLRDQGWKLSLEGLSAVPPWECFTLVPLSELTSCLESHNEFLNEGYILVSLDQDKGVRDLKSNLILGNFKPYIGSKTPEKIASQGKKLAKINHPLLSRPLSLQRLINWATLPDSNLAKTIRNCLSAVTDLNPELLSTDDNEQSGTLHHRLQDMMTKHGGMVSVLYTHGTKHGMISSYLHKYSKGSSNTNLMFQSLYSAFSTVLSWMFEFPFYKLHSSYHIHVTNNCCIQPVNEQMVDMPEVIDVSQLQMATKTALTWIPQDKLILPAQQRPWSSQSLTQELIEDPSNLLYTCMWLSSESSIRNIKRHISSDFSLNSLYPAGKMPFNWAYKLHPSEFFYSLGIRMISWILFTRTQRSVRWERLEFILNETFASLDPKGFEHLDTFLTMEGVLDYLVLSGISDSLNPDPFLSRTSLSNSGLRWLKNVCLSILQGTLDNSVNSFVVSSMTCTTDQHPLLLSWVVKVISGGDEKEKNFNLDIYRRLALALRDSRTKDLSSVGSLSFSQLEWSFRFFIKPNDWNLVNSHISSSSLYNTSWSLDSLCKMLPSPPMTLSSSIQDKGVDPDQLDLILKDSEHSQIIHEDFFPSLVLKEIKIHSDFVFQKERSPLIKDHSNWGEKISLLPTSAPFKLFSIFLKLGLSPSGSIEFMTLGEGAGGFLYSLLILFPQSRIFYNTLKIIKDPVEQPMVTFLIPSLTGCPDLQKRVIGLPLLQDGITDLLSPSFPGVAASYMRGPVGLITSDAEAVSKLHSENLLYIKNIIALAEKVNWPPLLIKLYIDQGELFFHQLEMLTVFYSSYKIIRSHFSSPTNSEVYVFVFHPRKDNTSILLQNEWIGNRISDSVKEHIKNVRDSDVFKECKSNISSSSIIKSTLNQFHPLSKNHTSQLLDFPFLQEEKEDQWKSQFHIWVNRQFKVPKIYKPATLGLKYSSLRLGQMRKWISIYLTVYIACADPPQEIFLKLLKEGEAIIGETISGLLTMHFRMTPEKKDNLYRCRVVPLHHIVSSAFTQNLYKNAAVLSAYFSWSQVKDINWTIKCKEDKLTSSYFFKDSKLRKTLQLVSR